MTTAAIEIHDAGILAVREGAARPVVDSPGYAVLDGKEVLTGRAARAKSRLLPRHCHTRFWDPLDRAPLPKPFPPRMTGADLAHAHLSALFREISGGIDRVLFVVPGFYSDEELGLLLGIARAASIPAVALVDLALASALEIETPAAIHLDFHLHRIVAARIERGEVLTRTSFQCDDGAGLVALENAWALAVAQKFVRETRFDPLHDAETEQTLYDRLPSLLDALREKESETLLLASGGKDHAVEIERAELVEVSLPFYRRLFHLARSLDPRGTWPQVLLSARVAALPGIGELVAKEVSPVVSELPSAIAGRNALKYRHRLPASASEDGAIPFAASLPLSDPTAAPELVLPPPTAPRGVAARAPTHVLHDGRAYPIDPSPFLLGVDVPEGQRGLKLEGGATGVSRQHCTLSHENGVVVVEDQSRYGSFLNGRKLSRDKEPLRAGDRLRLGSPGVEIVLIEVLEDRV